MDSPHSTVPEPGLTRSRQRMVLLAFTLSVFTSALLLFGVQPMFARLILPILGGSPSVWSVAMVFFQTMLLAGYVYAHVLTRLERPGLAVGLHLALLVAAGVTLPLTVAKGWGEPPGTGAELWLIGLFVVSIGLPFFALSANNPLLQAWFVRTGHPDGRDPYFLYAASNVGSFIALLSYPVLLEPLLTLQNQNVLWSAGFWLLIVLIAGCGVLLLRAPGGARAVLPVLIATEPPPRWSEIGRWLFLAAVPSGLLVAVTVHISTDVAAAPLLWIAPLSLYLLTWVVVFQRRPLIRHEFILRMQPVAIFWVIVVLLLASLHQLMVTLAGHLIGFFIIAMAAHGELARRRPAAAYLTTFYIALSAGGMIGGLFAGLLAPHLFTWVAEYPILLGLAVLCRPWSKQQWTPFQTALWLAVLAAAVVLLAPKLVFGWAPPDEAFRTIDWAVLAAATAGTLLMLGHQPFKAAVMIGAALTMMHIYPDAAIRAETIRSFYGVHKIFDTQDGQYRVLMHGTTIHGAQQLTAADGTPLTGRPEPISYYHQGSPMAQAVRAARALKAVREPGAPLRVGVIGLGAGSLACLSEPGEAWRFFEIDPAVVGFARDTPRFTFVRDCAPQAEMVIGDARLTMAREPEGRFDIIIVDAYSSDAIPIHLSTREAMALYKSRLADTGLVVMHVSNRHLELASVVAGIADANGMETWHYDAGYDGGDGSYSFTSEVVVAAKTPEAVAGLVAAKGWEQIGPDPDQSVWSDDYSNIVGAVLRRMPAPDFGWLSSLWPGKSDPSDDTEK